MGKCITVAIAGLGSRGYDEYAQAQKQFPQKMKIVAVADIDPEKVQIAAKEFDIPKKHCYGSAEEMLEQKRLADVMFIATQDRQHVGQAIPALRKGYHLLLEKPISPALEECRELVEVAKECNRRVVVCHVLRYTPIYQKVKELLAGGEIGEIVSIMAAENVGWWHMAHSFVRGNWNKTDESCPMILAKCCHDMDILTWLAGSKCSRVSSIGGLSHFNKEHRPEGAPDRCLDGCPHRDTCPYYAPRFYLEHPKAIADGFRKVVSFDTSNEAVLKELQTSPYGRCVYACDNDVVDNQIVSIEYENGVRASLTMSAFTEECERIINVMGSHGQIKGHMETNTLEVLDFASGHKTIIEVHTPSGGSHSGSDVSMMREFVELVASGATDSKTGATASVESHLATLAAEESRLQGGMPIDLKQWTTSI